MLPQRQKLRISLTVKFLLTFSMLFAVLFFVSTIIILNFPSRNDPSTFLLFSFSVVLVNVIVTVLIGWIIITIILRPLEQVYDAMESLNKGDLNVHIAVRSSDEIGDFAQTLNTLATNIRNFLSKTSTERQQLFLQNNKVETVLSTIADAVIAVDLNRNITLFNHAAETIIGLPANAVIGKPIQSVIRIYDKKDEISPLTYCPVSAEGSDGVPFTKDNLQVVSPQKESFVNLISRQIKQGTTINLGCILTMHDITHEKQLEEMKMDFVSMAAHELRTPLTSIKGYLSVFIDENKATFKGDQLMFLNRIMNSTEILLNLVENILNVSRVERGTLSVNRQPIDWLPLVTQAVANLTNRAKEKNIELKYLGSNIQAVQVDADKLRITEVLNNLIANAINYTHQGGTISVWVEAQGTEVTTHVKDTGVGIPQEAMARLFSKFYRVNNKLEMTKGTGLGLYISKAIIELHKGRIWVDSEPGKGSVFSFTLPILEKSQLKLSSLPS